MKKIALGSSLGLFALQSYAAVPASVTTSIETAATDMATVAAAVFVAVIGLLGFKLMRRAAH
jgi:Inovirus Coat protein B